MERIKWFIVGLPESLREEKQPKDSGGTRRPARCRGRREGADSAPSPWRKTKPPASLPALPAPSRAAAEGNAFTPAHSACSQRFAALPARMRHALGMRSVRAGEKAGRKCCWRRTVARRAGGQVREGRGAGLRGSKGRAAPGGLRGGSAARCGTGRHRAQLPSLHTRSLSLLREFSPRFGKPNALGLHSAYIYIYIYAYTHVYCVYIYIYTLLYICPIYSKYTLFYLLLVLL